MKYLLANGVKSKNVLIHGHSLGGAVGACLRSRYPDGPFISDRSFSSLPAVVKAILKASDGLRIFTGLSLGVYTFVVVSAFLEFNYSTILMNAGIGAALCSYLAYRFPKPCGSLVGILFRLIGWDLNSVKIWPQLKGMKLVIYHPMDGIIPHHEASLAETLKANKHSEDTFTIQLSYLEDDLNQPSPLYHCYPLHAVSVEWSALMDWARNVLSPSSR